ncbi:MAG: HD domain-containing protein [Lachnospiraceae bacterium]|nr:HD domain-containing protein [Lachnospiraceae bacterium]
MGESILKGNMPIPDNVKYIISTLQGAGFEAFAVGGCVRDVLLDRKPADWDITTNAEPLQVKKLFRRTIDTGIKHGTVTVMMSDEEHRYRGYEVTTYRIDGEYEDSRHPREVTFTKSLREDLERRDFTINAMAYNEDTGLVDEFGGSEDLKKRIIRAVGDPYERFSEDALRILRAYRFAAQLGFGIDMETEEAAVSLRGSLKKISAERIQTEFTKLLCSPHPDVILDMYRAGITSVIMPEFDTCMKTEQRNKHHLYNVGEHTVRALMVNAEFSGVEFDAEALRYIRYALLFHDFGKPGAMTEDEDGARHFKGHALISERISKEIMRRFKLDNDTVNTVSALVRWHDYRPEATEKNVRRAMNRIGPEIYWLLFPIRIADTLAQSMYKRGEKLAYEKEIMCIYSKVMENGDAVTLKDLAVKGEDLIAHGYKPGPELGKKLKDLLELVLENPECNTKEYLLSKI